MRITRAMFPPTSWKGRREMLTLLNLSIIPIAAGIQAVGPWPMIIGGLFMVVIAGREIRKAWRCYNRTFPREIPGDRK